MSYEGYEGDAGAVPPSPFERTIGRGLSYDGGTPRVPGRPGSGLAARVAEMQVEAIKHEEKARRARLHAEALADLLDSIGEADQYNDGAVLYTTVMLGNKTFSFVLLRAGGFWYSSGRRDVGLTKASWDTAIAWLVEHRVSVLVEMQPGRQLFPAPEAAVPDDWRVRALRKVEAAPGCTREGSCPVHPGVAGMHSPDGEPPF